MDTGDATLAANQKNVERFRVLGALFKVGAGVCGSLLLAVDVSVFCFEK